MVYADILERIRAAIGSDESYIVPTNHLEAREREALTGVMQVFERVGASAARQEVEAAHRDGRIDHILRLSALGVIAAHPDVRDYAEASRLASAQEFAALGSPEPRRSVYVASAHRHRGVIAFFMERYEVALERFTSALERERSAENLGNVMAALARLGDEAEARALRDRIRTHFPEALVEAVEARIALDADLRVLR